MGSNRKVFCNLFLASTRLLSIWSNQYLFILPLFDENDIKLSICFPHIDISQVLEGFLLNLGRS